MREGDYEKVGPTAHYTAYIWYRAGFPYGELFRTRRGALFFRGFRALGEEAAARALGLPTLERYLEQRHTMLERAVQAHEPDLLVELGAGLSRRGITWAADHEVEVLEIDLPHMVWAKRALIEDRAPRGLKKRLAGRFRQLSLNLLEPEFPARLAEALEGKRRPVVVAEGLLPYFPIPERRALMGAIAEGLARGGGGVFLTPIHTQPRDRSLVLAARAVRAGIGLVTGGRGAAESFRDLDEVKEAFRRAGFEEARILDRGALPERLRFATTAEFWRAEVGPRA